MCEASLRASATHAQTLQNQADSRKRMASIRAHQCVSKQCNMYISFCNKLGPDFVHLVFCHRMMYRKSVALCNKAHYTKLDVDLFNNVV